MKRVNTAAMAVLGVGTILLSACGNSVSTTEGQPVSGGTLLVSFKDDLKTLDPAIGYDTDSWSIERAIYNGLLDYKGFTTQLQPDIAASMPAIATDGKTYTFKLRKDVKFSNGRGVTADDFKYSWERMLDPKTAGPMTGGSFWGGIHGAGLAKQYGYLRGEPRTIRLNDINFGVVGVLGTVTPPGVWK